MLSIEIWDTGIGIPRRRASGDLRGIPSARQCRPRTKPRPRSRPLHRAAARRNCWVIASASARSLGQGFRLRHRSRAAAGERAGDASRAPRARARQAASSKPFARSGTILVVEDDPEVRELLELLLEDEGYRTATAPDGVAALDLVARGDGPARSHPRRLQSAERHERPSGRRETARGSFAATIPVVILTGDISTGTLRDIALQRLRAAQQAGEAEGADAGHPASAAGTVTAPRARAPQSAAAADGSSSRSSSSSTTTATCARRSAPCSRKTAGPSRITHTCEAFLEAYRPGREACLLVDAYLPGMSGLELLQRLARRGPSAAGHHDHRRQRRADGGAGHEGGRARISSRSRSAATNCSPASRARSNSRAMRASCPPGGRRPRATSRA